MASEPKPGIHADDDPGLTIAFVPNHYRISLTLYNTPCFAAVAALGPGVAAMQVPMLKARGQPNP